jgi:orotate phosphoribosyltransferase
LFNLLQQLSFKRGEFTLASGAKSSWYMDCRITALSAEGSLCIGELLGQAILNHATPIHGVGGMVLGAAPLVTSVTHYTASIGRPINGFLVRKEAKQHGGGKQVEGHLEPWHHVVLVEDVVTTGGSTLRAIEAIKKASPHTVVEGVIALIDRNAGGKEAFAQVGVTLQSLFSIDAFLQG